MKTVALVAPVTALEFIHDAFLLSGEGPVLTAFSLQRCPRVCVSLSVLQHYRIHGIRLRSSDCTKFTGSSEKGKDESNLCDLAVFGGKAVRLVRLHVGERLRLELLGTLVELQDWALDVRWLPGDNGSCLCVATAHNRAILLDASTGNSLVQRSCVEGCLLYSALLLVHESWADAVLVGGTVFNQLVVWRPGGGREGHDPDHKAPVEQRLLGHSGVIFSICYLQEKGWMASASDDRSVRVWHVGALGGPTGGCGDLNPACLLVLYGHQARVFSVRLSPGKVFSGGEDGACLVWDWAGGGTVARTLKGHRAGGVRALAISEGTGEEASRGRWVATGGADGGVRLWRVEESEEKAEDAAAAERLTDLKFSEQGTPKAVCLAGENDSSWSSCQFVVCTDQGTVHRYSDGRWEKLWIGTPQFQSYCVMETVTITVKDSLAKANLCAVGNLCGSIQVFLSSQPQGGVFLTAGSGKVHSLLWQEGGDAAFLLASGADGLVRRWSIEVRFNEKAFMSLSVDSLQSFLLPPCAKRWLTAAVRLCSSLEKEEAALWVCGDRRGSLLLFQEGRTKKDKVLLKQTDKAAESEDGTSEMKEKKEGNDPALQPLSCLFGVHGKQGVTSVYEHQGLLYSTGRDGCVRVFRVRPTPPRRDDERTYNEGRSTGNWAGLELEVLRVQRACKGMEWLERIMILKPEGTEEEDEEEEEEDNCGNRYKTEQHSAAMLGDSSEEILSVEEVKMETRGREARFVILGFHAVHFVVWDPVKQERLLAVPCGGGHRSWSLWPSSKGVWPGHGALVFIKQGSILASQPPGEALSPGRTGGLGLREGVHGRGIGCVCRLGRIRGTHETQTSEGKDEVRGTEFEAGQWEILATGGEDTSVSIVAVQPSSGSVRVLAVITDHISTVRAVTAVTREAGPQLLSVLLISAGGRAQIQCYRLTIGCHSHRPAPSCQVVQVAAHRLDCQWEKKRNRHKTVKMDPETRYMCAAVLDGTSDPVLLALACSDRAVRLFSVSEGKRQIDFLWETFHHQRCVLSVAACSLQDGRSNRYQLLFSAATDGRIAVWDLTAAPSSSRDSPPIPLLDVPAHQSGINSLAVWAEEQGEEEGGCLVTVASGGDDGQLTVSRIDVRYPEGGDTGGSGGLSPASQTSPPHSHLHLGLLSQSRVPLAHAAPLTALKLLSRRLIVSTSPDQRVCLWRVCSGGICHIAALYSHVADAAGLSVWEGPVMEEGEEKRKTPFESEQDIAIWGGRESQTGLETMGETVERKTDDLICKMSDEEGEETASDRRLQSVTDGSGEEEGTSCERRKRREQTGWVLVCGQGIQLLQVPHTQMDEDMWKGGKSQHQMISQEKP